MHGAPGTLYEGETFNLQVDFPEHYPMEAPLVQTRQLTTVYSCLSNFTVVLLFMKLVMGGGLSLNLCLGFLSICECNVDSPLLLTKVLFFC